MWSSFCLLSCYKNLPEANQTIWLLVCSQFACQLGEITEANLFNGLIMEQYTKVHAGLQRRSHLSVEDHFHHFHSLLMVNDNVNALEMNIHLCTMHILWASFGLCLTPSLQ